MILSDLDNIAYNKFANGEITLAEYIKYQNRDKMINYEKLYKNALKKARHYHSKDYMLINSAIENIFPELSEPEDDRIRKGIIELVKQSSEILDKQNQNNMIAWLEKQNPAWSEKDKNLLNRLIGVLDGTNEEDYHEAWEETFLPWLKSLKERMQSQPKQCDYLENYDNDEKIRKRLINFLKSPFVHENITDEKVAPWIAWLEKQGEKKPADEVLKIRQELYQSGYNDGYKHGQEDMTKSLSIGENINHTDIKEKAHQIAWETSKEYDPSLSKEAWCEMAALDMASWLKREVDDAYLQGFCDAKNEIEKQGTQNPANKPKFHPGNWIVDDETPNDVFCVIEVLEEIYKVIDIDGDDYHIPHCKADKQFHLWSIDDAKDGDVLVDGYNNIGLYSGEKDDLYWHSCIYLGCDAYLRSSMGCHRHKNTKPATKEQRDLLFKEIHDAGYEWDTDKKELKKIEQDNHPRIVIRQDFNGGEGLYKINLDNLNEEQVDAIEMMIKNFKQGKKLDADKVIEWIEDQACVGWIEYAELDTFIKQFKQYFGL